MAVAWFVKEMLCDDPEYRDTIDIVGLFELDGERLVFCHAVVAANGRYYDVFHPEGVDSMDKIMYSDACSIRMYPEKIIDNFFARGPVEYLRDNLFKKVEEMQNV